MKLFGANTNSGMIRKISDWFGMTFNPNESGHSELIRINPIDPNETEFFRSIRVHSDRPDSFGLNGLTGFNPITSSD